MAVTVTVDNKIGAKNARMHKCTWSTTDNYVTGGYSITPAQCGLSRIDFVLCNPAFNITATGAYVTAWVLDTGVHKLKLYWVDTTVDGAMAAEVPNATALTFVVGQIMAVGV